LIYRIFRFCWTAREMRQRQYDAVNKQ